MRSTCLLTLLSILPLCHSFVGTSLRLRHAPFGGTATLNRPLSLSPSPVLSHPRRVARSRKATSPRMAISVLGALTAPLVAVAALGTLDGFGKLVMNLPRIIEYQFRYANRIMQRGNGCQPTEAIDVLRTKLDENKEYRFNALKLFVKYDTDEDGKLSIEDLNRCLKNEFPQGVTDGMISSLVDAMDSDKDSQIDCYEFLSAVSGSSKNADKLLQE
eukprot:746683-Hanusia_phi.AAC.2